MANIGVSSKATSERIDGAIKNTGRTNIIIAGRTGVGKSTLLNAIFKKEVAITGQGQPVTKEITEYPVEGTHVTLIDTRGIEMQEYQETVADLYQYIQSCRSSEDPNNHIHIAWMCILEGANRLEEGEISVIKMLQKIMPVVIVICQSYADDQSFIAKIKNEFSSLDVISVIAKEKLMRTNVTIPVVGLIELADFTADRLPEAHQTAFVAAQMVSLERKKKASHDIVVKSAILAGVAGATPVPFSDAVALIPIQITMISGITIAFGFTIDKSIIMAMWGSFVTVAGATTTGLFLASLLKFIPGVGTIAGGLIDATIASSLTTAFGKAYITILTKVFEENNGAPPTNEQLITKCTEQWKKKFSSSSA